MAPGLQADPDQCARHDGDPLVLTPAFIASLRAPKVVPAAILLLGAIGWRAGSKAQRRRLAAREASRAARAGMTVEEYHAAERRLERLSRELDAGEEFVEDLARHPR